MTNGVIYVARGAGYLDLSQASAQSLRAHNPGLSIDLYSDNTPTEPAVFDRILPIPDSGTRDKIACMALSRFDRTLFLDCDTLVLRPFGDLFDLMDRFDLAVCHDVRRASPLIRTGWRIDTPYAFPQLNTGVLLWRRNAATQAFLSDWATAYTEAGLPRDQCTFRDLAWSSDLRLYILPEEFNLRRITLLDAWEPLDARPTILHSHRLLQHLRGKSPRVTDLATLLDFERRAHADEWHSLGLPPRSAPDEDPLTRFAAAEAVADSDTP